MICIVTVYKSQNFGSYLQAKVLRDTLLQYDKDVFLLDGNFRPWILKSQIKDICRNLYHIRLWQVWHTIYKIFHNYCLWKNLPHITLKKIHKRTDVTFVFGSDEIWNVDREVCRISQFWGNGFEGKKIAYAPSVNNATLPQLQSIDGFKENLQNFSKLSVRDAHSSDVISSLLGVNIPIVLDPTLLQTLDYYKGRDYAKLPYKYIAIYAFFLKKEDINNIQHFSKERNLKTVMLSGKNDWCDICLNIKTDNPFLYYIDADYIVTDTFHGTAFAINFQKDFVSLAYNNSKIYDLLSDFDLLNRVATNVPYRKFCNIMDEKISFSNQVVSIIREKREYSLNFIKNAIKHE